MRNVAGETLLVALMPLHPAASNKTVPHIANRAVFQSNLTSVHYRLNHGIGNFKFAARRSADIQSA
jgi:hypothetical protein